MGGLLVSLGPWPAETARESLVAMAERARHRGELHAASVQGGYVGIQALDSEASLAVTPGFVVAITGYVRNWDEVTLPESEEDSRRQDAGRLLEAYRRLGEPALARLRGEFAAVIADTRGESLVLVRESVGRAPLFWGHSPRDGSFFAASEIRQVLAGAKQSENPNLESIALWLAAWLADGENTDIAGVQRLAAGVVHAVSLARPGLPRPGAALWSPPLEEEHGFGDFQALAAQLRSLLEKVLLSSATGGRVSLSLSGGIDSSAIWSILMKARSPGREIRCEPLAIHAAYPGLECDESDLVRALAAKTGGAVEFLDCSGFSRIEQFDELSHGLDGPFHHLTSSLLPWFAAAKSSGRDRLLLGSGPDEFFNPSHAVLAELLCSLDAITAIRAILRVGLANRRGWRILSSSARSTLGKWRRWGRVRARSATKPAWLGSRYWDVVREAQERKKARFADAPRYRASMLNSLERYRSGRPLEIWEQLGARFGAVVGHPLVDQDLLDFSFRVPAHLMGMGRTSKPLFRRALQDLLPGEILNKPTKTVFDTLRDLDLAELRPAITESRGWNLCQLGVLDANGLDRLVEQAYHDQRSAKDDLLRLAACEAWVRVRFL